MAALTILEVFTRFPLLDENGDPLLDENGDPIYDEWFSQPTGPLTITEVTS